MTGDAERPGARGPQVIEGPGYDQESTSGLVGAGATLIVFNTGRGTTIGNAIAPVVKLSSNSAIFERMSHDIDLSAGGVIDGTETIDAVGARLFGERHANPACSRAAASRPWWPWSDAKKCGGCWFVVSGRD